MESAKAYSRAKHKLSQQRNRRHRKGQPASKPEGGKRPHAAAGVAYREDEVVDDDDAFEDGVGTPDAASQGADMAELLQRATESVTTPAGRHYALISGLQENEEKSMPAFKDVGLDVAQLEEVLQQLPLSTLCAIHPTTTRDPWPSAQAARPSTSGISTGRDPDRNTAAAGSAERLAPSATQQRADATFSARADSERSGPDAHGSVVAATSAEHSAREASMDAAMAPDFEDDLDALLAGPARGAPSTSATARPLAPSHKHCPPSDLPSESTGTRPDVWTSAPKSAPTSTQAQTVHPSTSSTAQTRKAPAKDLEDWLDL